MLFGLIYEWITPLQRTIEFSRIALKANFHY